MQFDSFLIETWKLDKEKGNKKTDEDWKKSRRLKVLKQLSGDKG